MKNLIIIVFVVFLVCSLYNKEIIAQWGVGPELLIANKTGNMGNELYIKFFPIGAVYNSNFLYSPKIGDGPLFENGFEYLVGFDTTLNSNITEFDIVYGHFDGLGVNSQCVFAYGLGLYKLEFYNIDHTQLLNYCYIDWRDANVYLTPYYTTDLAIEYFNQDRIKFLLVSSRIKSTFKYK